MSSPTGEAHYRAMDFLLEVEDELAERVYASVANLLNLETDLLLFDTTSTYFELEEADVAVDGEGAEQAGFRSHGNSKDHRGDLPQVVVGLAVTREGIPIRCWVWPGNTADQALIRQAKDDLRAWQLSRVVWVGDRGFASAENRRYLQRAGGHYILGEKLRSHSPEAQAALSRQGRYRQVAGNLRVKEVTLEDTSDRFVICHNPEQADRDQAIRDRLVAQLSERISGSDALTATRRTELRGELRTKPGLHRFLRVTKGGRLRVDQTAINAEAKLDGKFLLRTSDPSLTPEDVALGYKQLAEVEAGWRDMTHTLDLRPIYHRLEDRIRARA
ncbi:IS1634 family transposase [Egibacter rhizosphaerae]|uniref:IS1634 family transposase n=1 Tax=Egibacter rhizosphaerae TaxID=1670831 RepID=A0A411YH16_9ACTN|nr:IS1634 family transposase [Egibacter rhizosphaerae]QBI20530.1 IS1634 family transposase [Egibacter rhizosphaerae]